MKKILSLLSVMLLAVAGMYGQQPAPGILNYQGVARNSVGNVLVNKNITLRLTIRDGSAAGPTVYAETRAVTTNPFGLFNVQLGSPGATSVTGSIPAVPWGVGLKFIQVEIDPNGGSSFINIGTAQLASVPYALYATTANDLVLPFIKTQADNGVLFSITNSGNNTGSRAIEGATNSTQANAFAVVGTVTNAAPGAFSTGVRGINNGTGGNGIGVWGSQAGSGYGVYATTPAGWALRAETNSGVGVYGQSGTGIGVQGVSNTGSAGVFNNTNSGNAAVTLTASSNGTGDVFNATTTGTGSRAGLFQNNNAANTQHVLAINNAGGSGNAVNATTAGTGSAGLFNINNTTSTATALQATTVGTGGAGSFTINNAAATADALTASTNGAASSWALRATSTGAQGAGIFTYNNTGGSANAVRILNNGSGISMFASTSGTGNAGRFDNTNATNPSVSLLVNTNGLGGAGSFVNTNATSTATTLSVTSNVTSGGVSVLQSTSSATTGASNLTAIRANNNSTNDFGIGVWGGHDGSGWGVYGFARNGGAANWAAGGYFDMLAGSTPGGAAVRGNNFNTGGFAGHFINNSISATSRALRTQGAVQMTGINEGLNRVLTSIDALGNAQWQPLAAVGIVGGSGTLNRVAKWTPDGFNIGNSLTWDDGSRVRTGLGLTFTDNNTLTLINTAATGNNAVLSFQGNSGLGNASGIYLEDATNQTHITTGNYDAVNGTKVVTVDGNLLNVGIGTNTPGGVKLNVHNSGSSFALTKYTNTGTGQSTFTDGFVVGQNSSTGVGSILLWNLENTDIEVGTNSSTRMWIKNNGFVGIGTSTPVGQLHVDGNGTATTVTPTWINYTPNSYFRNTAPSNDNKVGGLGFADGSTGNFNEGLTGIAGGTASGANIGVVGLAGETATGFNIGLFAQVANGSSGNYGVYSLAPANATSWAGAFVGRVQIADGTQGLGRIFTSDAGGTGSWQTPAAAGLVSGSGTLNFIPKWTPNGTTLGNSLLQDNGNAVKLGNSAFYNGNSLNIYPTPTSSEPALLIGDGQVGGFYLEQATGNLHITLNGANIPSGNHVMTFDDNNLSVGIGTTTPVARLHVENTASNIGGVRVYQPNENNIPGLKSLTGGTISNDLSVFSAWGRNSIYAQRGDFTSGGMIVLGSGDAILGTGFGTNNAIQGNAQDGNAITGTIFLGTGTALRGFAPGSNALALHTTGNVRLQGIGESNGYVLTSDAAGNATWQGPVGIQLANMSASVNIPFAYTPITQWQTIVYEDGGANYNPVTGEYTVPVSGVYSITSNLGFFQVASNGYSSLLVYVNGAQIIDSRESAVANTFPGSKVSITRRLNAGDRISIWSYANGATFNTINSGDFCTLSIKLINR